MPGLISIFSALALLLTGVWLLHDGVSGKELIQIKVIVRATLVSVMIVSYVFLLRNLIKWKRESRKYREEYRDRHFRNLRIRLASLRPLLADSSGAQKYLRLFDEFIRECEFGLALATLCDFLFETPTLVNRDVVEQIEQLHSLMNVKDMPLEKLRALARPK